MMATSDMQIAKIPPRMAKTFYSSPVISFISKSIHYAVFVLLYTYVGITLRPDTYRMEELLMHVWIISLVVTEIRQVYQTGLVR
jgi:hypothetical protein